MVLVSLTGSGILGERIALAQNTYLDAPFQQGSMRYRPSGNKPPKTTSSRANSPRGLFRRNVPTNAYAYPPQTYQAQAATRPAAPNYYYYPPTAAYPNGYYYYWPK
jgi:hypothetical protein